METENIPRYTMKVFMSLALIVLFITASQGVMAVDKIGAIVGGKTEVYNSGMSTVCSPGRLGDTPAGRPRHRLSWRQRGHRIPGLLVGQQDQCKCPPRVPQLHSDCLLR